MVLFVFCFDFLASFKNKAVNKVVTAKGSLGDIYSLAVKTWEKREAARFGLIDGAKINKYIKFPAKNKMMKDQTEEINFAEPKQN